MGIRIWGDGAKITSVNGADKVNKAYKSQNTEAVADKKDNITISESAKDYNMVTKLLKDIPEVRSERVNELKGKLETGEYKVNENDIAQKLLEHLQQENA